MRHQTIVELPKKGQQRFYDRGDGIEEILKLLTKKKDGVTVSIMSAAGGGVGKLENPKVRKYRTGYSITGVTTSEPGREKKFYFYTDDKHIIPRGKMLTTIGSIYVKSD